MLQLRSGPPTVSPEPKPLLGVLPTSLSVFPRSAAEKIPSLWYAHVLASVHFGPPMFSAVFAFRFVVLVAATNNGQEGSVPISKVIALLVGYPGRSSVPLVGTGPLKMAARLNQLSAPF